MRLDHLFSNWIIVWYIIFMFDLTKYNPKFALIVAILQNLIGLIYKLLSDSIYNVFIFAMIMFFIKLIPLYTIIHTKIKKKDIYFTIFLFILYNIWLYINRTNMYKIIIELKNNNGPLFLFMVSMMNRK